MSAPCCRKRVAEVRSSRVGRGLRREEGNLRYSEVGRKRCSRRPASALGPVVESLRMACILKCRPRRTLLPGENVALEAMPDLSVSVSELVA